MSDRMDINRLLLEMRAMKSQTQAFGGGMAARDVTSIGENAFGAGKVNGPQFGDLLAQAVDKVNDVQQASGAKRDAYIKGDPNVDITDVMIASQKASVSFDAMVQVRNKVVEAYRDVMNMPV